LTTPHVAVVIPTFNSLGALKRCLKSIEWASHTQTSVVVVDSGSSDGTREYLKTVPWVVSFDGSPDMWWAAATNAGCSIAVRKLGVDAIALLNCDCTWDESSFVALRDALLRRPGDIHCSRVLVKTPRALLSAGGVVRRSGLLSVRGFYASADTTYPGGEVEWCGGMGVLFSASLWSQLGGFDEMSFPHYYADADFCLRARKAGRAVWYCADSVLENDRDSSALYVPKTGARLSDLAFLLVSRRSPSNIRDSFLFYRRHAGPRLPAALADLYWRALGSGVKRIVLSSARELLGLDRGQAL
jgi:GT2 family glycosyltransferase